MYRRLLLFVIIIAVVAAGGWGAWHWLLHRKDEKLYRTAPLERGDIVQTVRATGTIQPVKLVQVGTQVTGPVSKLYVDYNSQVKEGQVVAQIDPAVYEARVAQDKAGLQSSLADVEQVEAKLKQADKDLGRVQELVQRDLAPRADLDAAVANRDALAAQLKLSHAAVEQSKAVLHLSETNLQYTTIKSPVDGVVVARNVTEGQTVVASLTAQTLFLIANDLRHVQVEASVAEADIGSVKGGQPVSFTVDAYPDEEFGGAVAQVRLAAATVQNVVTYPVIINADNPEEKLLPGMTATISCEVARRRQVLKLPNAALRFKPEGTGTLSASGTPRTLVWTLEGNALKSVPVTLGISDGSFTEIISGELEEGQQVAVGILEPGMKAAAVNPFTPRMPSKAGGRPPRP